MPGADEAARSEQRSFYDARYERGYMRDFSDFYEACRVRTIAETLRKLSLSPGRILDYGCGEGRYVGLLHETYPQAEIVGSDVSAVGLALAAEQRPYASYRAMTDERVPEPDAAFDLILSVEVLEHVADVELATKEIGRLLAPGGAALISTPCANRWSIEWLAMKLSGGLQRSFDGFERFRSDEPGHLRRLSSSELADLLADAGLRVEQSRYRGQVFAYPAASRYARKLLPDRARVALGMLDWRLFRRLPNGSTMLVVAKKHQA